MESKGREACDPASTARMLAKHAAELARKGRKNESETVFRRAFEKVREVRGPLGSLRNDVGERSRLATVLSDRVVSAGLSAKFAVEMWRYGCNSGVLSDEDRGSTHMFYPVEIMGMAMREKGGMREEDAAPPAVCEVEKEGRPLSLRSLLPWPVRDAVSAWWNLFFGERESGKRERTGENE